MAAVFVVVAVLGWQVLGVPRVSAVTPGPNAYVKDRALTVILDVHGLQKLTGVRVTFDGRDMTARATRTASVPSGSPGRSRPPATPMRRPPPPICAATSATLSASFAL